MNVTPVIPDHELLRLIGRGSYGEVWLARSVLGTLRAAKVVFRADFDSPRPFEREFHGIQRFEPVSRSHDGLVDILQVGRNDADGYFYYVMELADAVTKEDVGAKTKLKAQSSKIPSLKGKGRDPGTVVRQAVAATSATVDSTDYAPRTLAADLAARGRLPAAECVEIFHSLALALAHLHEAGLVHRDIKPSNIIFVGGAVKFADIGLVTAADDTGSFVGTEGFIPPEGSGAPTADIYSLGKVLYEAATGRDRKEFPALPLDANDLAANAGLLELNAIIVKACAANPAQRYASAEAVVADLALLRAGKSVKASRQQARRRALGLRVGLPSLATIVLLALVVMAWQRNRPATAATPPTTAAAPQQTAAELLAQVRRLRSEALPGWRTTALDLLTKAQAIHPLPELRQEAVFALAAADLRPLSWTPPGPAAPLLVDFPRDRYVSALPDGTVSFRSLRDHTELFHHDQQIKPVERFIDFSVSGNWLALQASDGSLRFRRCDPGTGAWYWSTRENAPNHAAFNLEGKMAAYTFGTSGTPENSLTLSPTSDMGQKRYIRLPGPFGKFAWSPSELRIAVLISQPPAVALIDVALGTVSDTFALGDPPLAFTWQIDARHIICSTRREVLVIDTATGELEPFAPGLGGITSLSLDESGHLLATTGADGRVRLWDVPAKRQLFEISLPAERVDLSPTGRQLVAYSAGQTHATLWEFASPRDIVHFLTPKDKALPLTTNAVAGLRLDGHAVWTDTGTNGPVQLPVLGEVKGVARSKNDAFVHVHLTDGSVQEWFLPRLKERLATLGFGW